MTTITKRSIERRNIKAGRIEEPAKRTKIAGFSWTKGHGFASRRGKRSNS